MKITQIRNATLHIVYGGKKFLMDPWLGPKGYMPDFEGAYHSEVRQPRTELPVSVQEATAADAVILTHIHPDHWDQYAVNALDKNVPFFVQSETDKKIIEKFGFARVRVLTESGARIANGERLIMDQEDVKAVCAYAPKAQIVASHMDTVSHLTVTREDLRALHLPNLLIPADGETLPF